MALLARSGDLIAGRYRIDRRLGEGGMGVVFEATHLQLAQRVAIKFLLPELCAKPEAVQRFLHEARAAVRLESEHVARVMDVGSLASGEPYMVMEHLEGSDLAQVLRQRKQLPVREAVDCVLQAADAIAEAHSLGIIHRDLKPSNLFLARRRDGSSLVKVLDFGISKAVVDLTFGAPGPRTASTIVMGSPHYMSPEQVRSSKSVDPRSDIWSLGVILHELLSGELPFEAETIPGVLAMIVADAPTRLRAVCPELPAGLEACILRCLQKDRSLRFEAVSDLAESLSPFATRQGRRSLSRIAAFGSMGRSTKASPEPDSRAPSQLGPSILQNVPATSAAPAAPSSVARERRSWAAIVAAVLVATALYASVRGSAVSRSAPASQGNSAAAKVTHTGRAVQALPVAELSGNVRQSPLGEARWRELERTPLDFASGAALSPDQTSALLEQRR